MRNHKLLFIFTLLYFILGFVNVHLALLGLVCMTIPFLLLYRDKKKTWCQHYCPRSSLYTRIGNIRKSSTKTPDFFVKGNMKFIMLSYFGLSLMIIMLSTLGVAVGRMQALEQLRFLLFFPVPGSLPQFIILPWSIPWLTHLSYRFYSMMMTTTVLGLALALICKPRTWCTICPISTLSGEYIKRQKK